jgi:hypothetical protein
MEVWIVLEYFEDIGGNKNLIDIFDSENSARLFVEKLVRNNQEKFGENYEEIKRNIWETVGSNYIIESRNIKGSDWLNFKEIEINHYKMNPEIKQKWIDALNPNTLSLVYN